MPQTKAEIVQYYNEAANRVKREKPGFRWTETTYIGEIKLGNALMNSLVKPIVNLFDQEPRAQSPVPKGADHSLFPVKGQNYASKMEVSDVKDAQCVEKNGSYEITLRFKDEERDALPENPAEETRHGRFMNVTSAQENKVETAKFEKFLVFEEYKPNYRNCEIKCSIAIDSARLRSVTFRFCTDAEVRANAKGIAFGAQMRYTSTQKFILG